MGTNYYWEPTPKPCPTCGHDPSERVHIGKLSGGWEFSFHGSDAIRSWMDWQTVISGDGVIYDEYGREVTADELIQTVEAHKGVGLNHYDYCIKKYPGWGEHGDEWKDAEGHSFSGGEFS